MRLLVSWLCGSINAHARSAHFKTARRTPRRDATVSVTHILQVENTRSEPAPGRDSFSIVACSMKKKITESPIYFTVNILRLRRRFDGECFWASPSGRAIPSEFQLSTRFSRVWQMAKLSENVSDNLSRRALHSKEYLIIVWQEEIMLYYWMTIILINDRFLSRTISIESTVDHLIYYLIESHAWHVVLKVRREIVQGEKKTDIYVI